MISRVIGCPPAYCIHSKLKTMDRKKLDRTAEKLLAIFEDHAKGLPAAGVDAKWDAFSKVASKVGTHAKRRADK